MRIDFNHEVLEALANNDSLTNFSIQVRTNSNILQSTDALRQGAPDWNKEQANSIANALTRNRTLTSLEITDLQNSQSEAIENFLKALKYNHSLQRLQFRSVWFGNALN